MKKGITLFASICLVIGMTGIMATATRIPVAQESEFAIYLEQEELSSALSHKRLLSTGEAVTPRANTCDTQGHIHGSSTYDVKHLDEMEFDGHIYDQVWSYTYCKWCDGYISGPTLISMTIRK